MELVQIALKSIAIKSMFATFSAVAVSGKAIIVNLALHDGVNVVQPWLALPATIDPAL